MLKRLELHNFKAFRKFTVTFSQHAFLVGPNNAGKSTVIAAVRTGAAAMRLARARRAEDGGIVEGVARRGHMVPGDRLGLVEENLRHEFHPGETRLVFHFSDDAKLEILWEPDEDDERSPAFCTFLKEDRSLTAPRQVRAAFPDVGVIPVLSPVELREFELSEDHVRSSAERRLVSQHTRNHLELLLHQAPDDDSYRNQLDEFRAFAGPWITELALGGLEEQRDDENRVSLDFYYEEPGGRHPKELFWAGDGMQVWIQLLLHLYRLRHMDLILLDEPDLFLHADMQRRLVSLLEGIPGQVITATHSPEVLAEAPPDSVVWISRNRKRSERAPKPEVMGELSNALGTQFNLRLARALRAKAVVFVEGDDTKIIRNVARTVGAEAVAAERDVVAIPLRGFDRWHGLAAFTWMLDDFLEKSVTAWVILDRDYRTQRMVNSIEKKLADAGANPHIWARHELENYLVSAAAISRLTGADEDWVDEAISKATDDLRDAAFAGLTNAEMTGPSKEKNPGKASVKAQRRLEKAWSDTQTRRNLVAGKELLAGIRRRLQEAGFGATTDRSLSTELRSHEIPHEMTQLLRAIEASAQ